MSACPACRAASSITCTYSAGGVTVAFAATGRSPSGEGRPDALVYRVVREEPDLVGDEPRLQPVVAEAWHKEPDKRPAGDTLLVRVVKSAMGGEAPAGDADAMTTLALDRSPQCRRALPIDLLGRPSGRRLGPFTRFCNAD
jgi:hypothetical protein